MPTPQSTPLQHIPTPRPCAGEEASARGRLGTRHRHRLVASLVPGLAPPLHALEMGPRAPAGPGVGSGHQSDQPEKCPGWVPYHGASRLGHSLAGPGDTTPLGEDEVTD